MEVEETCFRLGIKIGAYIRNNSDPAFASDAQTLMDVDQVTTDLILKPVAFPMVTPGHRNNAVNMALSMGFKLFSSIIDPTTIIARSTQVGSGVYINAGCTIGSAGTIGNFVSINRHASLAHHFSISDYATIGPGVTVAGRVHIGRGAYIGAGAVLLPDIRIGENATVAAGAVVLSTFDDNTLVAGNPGKIKKTGIPGYGNFNV